MSDNNTKPKGISKSLKYFFGIGDCGFTLMSNIDTFYASYFFTNIARFSLGAITVMTTISAVIDAILSCFYGAFLNKIKPKKWGRYRSWLILTPWLVPFLYAMQFVKITNGLAGAIFITLAMITSRIAWNIPYIANVSMINIAGKTQEERMQLSSSRMVWTSFGTVIYSYVGPAAVAVFAGILGETNAYAATAFVFSALMAAGYYAHFRMTKGYEETGAEEMERLAAEQDGLKAGGEEGRQSVSEKTEQIQALLALIEEAGQKADGLRAEMEEQRIKKDGFQEQRSGFFAKREELTERISQLDKDLFRLQSQKEKLEEKQESFVEYLWSEYELTYSTAEELKEEPARPASELKKRIAENKGAVKALGNVNVNAIEDYREVSGRYEFMKSQYEDLMAAREALTAVITELDTGMRRQFTEKFGQISAEFNRVFRELFGGGHGSLTLMFTFVTFFHTTYCATITKSH